MQPPTTATSRAKRPSRLSAAVRARASYAYVNGRKYEMTRSQVAIWPRDTKSPHRKIWGKTTAGMNCTAWNSVCANALTRSPSVLPSTAFATARTTTSHSGPAVSRPRSPNASKETSVA
jgi:hypothetical protein